MGTYNTDADIRSMVIEVLDAGDSAEQFDIDGIVNDLKAAAEYDGRQFVGVPEGEDFWEIVGRHDSRTAVLEAAAEAHSRLAVAEAEVARIRSVRDDAIRAAIIFGTSMYAIAKHIGISEQAVARIRDRG